MEPVTILVIGLFAIILGTYQYVNRVYTTWKRCGIYNIEPKFPYGNCRSYIRNEEYLGDTLKKFYEHFKAKGLKGGGIFAFLKPIFVPVDMELVKCILQNDFEHFMNHGRHVNTKLDPLEGHLFNLENAKWRNMRKQLTPTFTSAKMKMMFQTFIACTPGLVDVIKESASIQDAVDIKEVVSRFSTDIIGSCAFGIECNSLKNPDSDFRTMGRKVFSPPTSIVGKLRYKLISLFPSSVLKTLGIKKMDPEIEYFFMQKIQKTVSYREKNQVKRNDFLHLLLQLKNEGKIEDDDENTMTSDSQQTLTIEELAAQCYVFFVAGFETSATTMSFALLELAQNQDIQDKLRDEIEEVLKTHNGKLSYEAVMEMTYLDKVVQETMRKHSPAAVVFRNCNKTYEIPGTDMVLEPGTFINIPIHGIHHDPEYYPDPKKFDPERFSAENKAKRPAFAYLAFGEGPRICIGSRFGLLQTKVRLLTIVRNFIVTLNKKTKTPIRYEPYGVITCIDGGLWLNVTPVNSN